MAQPTSFAMSKLFTDLIGRQVLFSQQAHPATTKGKQIYGTYLVKPMDSTRILQADLVLLGSLGGSLLGLPADTVKERIAEARMEEGFQDAVHEVLNIASTIVSTEYRAIFQNMYTHPLYLPNEAQVTLANPVYRSYFSVTVDGYDGGAFALLAPL